MVPIADGAVYFSSFTGTSSYSVTFPVPNMPALVGTTNYLVLAGNLVDSSGQAIIATSSNTAVNGGINIEDSAPMEITNGCPTPGVDLAVQVLDSRMVVNNLGQTVRTFRVKYTNTGTVTINSFNRTYGWVGGIQTTNTQNYLGTTSMTTPLQPGQSRILYATFNGASTPPQYPATYFHRINTVNGFPDANIANNYSTLIVNQ